MSEQFFSIIGYPYGPTFFLVLLKNLTRDPTMTPTRVYSNVPYKRVHEARVIPRVIILFEWSWKSRDVPGQWDPQNACSSTMLPESPHPNDFRHPLWTHALLFCLFFFFQLMTFSVSCLFSFLFFLGNVNKCLVSNAFVKKFKVKNLCWK